MEYTIIFTALGGALVAMGLRTGNSAFLVVWLGMSFLITGFGHAGLGALIYGKGSSGVLPLWSKLLHAPFLLYTWGTWHAVRHLSREDTANQVNDSLVIGRRVLPSELPGEFDNWVDLTAEFAEPKAIREGANYIALPILDGGVPTASGLQTALGRLRPGCTYVHCAQGHGRTGLFALALLFREGTITDVATGLATLREARRGLNMNARQRRFVQEYMDAENSVC